MILKLVLVLVTTLGVTLSKFPDVPYSDVRNISPINDGSYRIPNDTIPISYDILLEPNFETFTFDGEVIITIEVVEDTSTITLHANDLQIGTEDVEVDARNNEISPVVEDTEFVEDFHFFKIHLAEEVGAGEILEISIKYTGNLNTANRGFYRARYVENEIEKWFATTQFESTDARRAFPCYDEPALKATFTIRIIRPASYNSVSNMPLLEINDLGDGRFEDVFEESVLMSTYLVAFVVSEMAKTEVVENQAVIGVPFYINDGRGEFAQTTGIETVKAMEEFTGVQYTLDKLDQVAIPDNYFSAGAMENWGLVTYRESYLLYKDGISTSSEKQRIAAIISHEYGHQWFGNLVSPLWWTYIWLNEGFATYFEHYATDEVDPELRMMDQYVLLVNQYAMDNDALVSTRRMSYYAETPSDISRLFDRIAYEKSGSVIRMMEHFLTTATFRRGLNIYLNARGLKAAQASDLWEAMQQAISEESSTILGDLNIVDIMETWNMNTGFPVITVSRNEDGKVVLSQTRFFLDREAVDEDNPVWTVPINYYNADPENDFTDTRANYWLTAAEDTTDIDLADDEWFILNKQGIGYYRTDYSDELWSLNIDFLISGDYESIHPSSRAQIINDAFNLARSDRLSYKILMDLFMYLKRETDYVPLYSYFNALTYLHRFMVNTEHYETFKKFTWRILDAAFTSVTIEFPTDHTTKLNRVNVLNWLCRMGHPRCLEETNTLLTERIIATPDEQTPVYCGGLILDENTEENWKYIFDRYMGTEAESLEKSRLLSALGCTTSQTQLKAWLDIIVGIDEENSNSAFSVSTAFTGVVSAHKFGLDTALDYVIENFVQIQSSLSTQNVRSILTALGSRLSTAAQRTRLQGLYNSLSSALQTQHSESFTAAIASITSNIQEAAVHLPDVFEWLEVYAEEDAEFGYRLPTNTKPLNYLVTLDPDFTAFTFAGEVTMRIETLRRTRTVIWHEFDLIITNIEVKLESSTVALEIYDDKYEPTYQMRKIELAEPVEAGEILEITITYTGKLNEENEGFYRASYEEGGVTKWYGTTQFEAVHARRAFPCFDEPALKAKFTIRIIRPTTYNSISNTYRANEVPVGTKRMDTFEETELMSTYLVAFVVSEMSKTDEVDNQSVYGEPRFITDNRGIYARTTGIATLRQLEEYTGIDYLLNKIDQVAIGDSYFTFGAMENWGLVTYRARLLFYKDAVNTAPEKENIATVIAHEYAHQWFGNLVSPAWWEYIWLNEGFATYFESYIGNRVESTMNIMSRYVINNNQRAMESDSSSSSRPMNYNIEEPKDIMSLFDRIAYQKSGSVIRMMANILTPEIFANGLNIYLDTMKLGAAVPSDLWNALQTAVDAATNKPVLDGQTVASIMNTWASQAGYPVVTVTRTTAGAISIAQTRFLLTNDAGSTSSLWQIPINYIRSTAEDISAGFADTTITSWLRTASGNLNVQLAEEEWIMINKESMGYYRVDYDDTTWALITEYLNSDDYENIPPVSRSQLIDDVMNLAKVGRVTYNQTFDLLSYLKRETDYIPLYTYLRELDFLEKYLMTSDEHYEIFKVFVRDSLAAAYDDIESGEADHTMILKRNRVFSWLSKMEDATSLETLHTELAAAGVVNPDMQTLVYCGGLITDEDTEAKWNFLFEKLDDDSVESLERARVLNALGCTTSTTQLNRWLDIIAGVNEESTIEVADRVTALTATLNAHKVGFETAYQYILDNFVQLDTTLGSENTKSVIRTLANKLTNTTHTTQLNTLFNSLTVDLRTTYQETFETASATIVSNRNLLGNRLDDIKLWLENYDSSGITFSISISLILMALLSHLFM